MARWPPGPPSYTLRQRVDWCGIVEFSAMRSLRRGLRTLLLLIPFLGIAGAAAGQTFTADINGDGVRDRIETRRTPAELIIRLSTREAVQHLRFSGSILNVVAIDIDADGDSDLVATTVGQRHVRVFVWTNAGRGRFVSHAPKPRDALVCKRLVHKGVTSPGRQSPDEELCSDVGPLLVMMSAALEGRSMASEPLHPADEPLVGRLRYDRRCPRGPPSTLLFS